jgi:hypothetical protein
MIYLALVHLRDARCSQCGLPLAVAGARSFVVDASGEPIGYDPEQQPESMTVEIVCETGHANTFFVPNELAAEEVLRTPEDAPLGRDAVPIL